MSKKGWWKLTSWYWLLGNLPLCIPFLIPTLGHLWTPGIACEYGRFKFHSASVCLFIFRCKFTPFCFFSNLMWLVTCRIVYLVPGVSELCQIAEPAMWVGSWHRWLGMMAEVKLPVGSPAFDTVGSWSLCPDAFVGSLVSGTWSAVLAKMPRVSRAVVLLVAEAHQVLRLLSPAAGWAESWHRKLGVCVCLPVAGIYFCLAYCLVRDDPILAPSGWWVGWAWNLVTRL